MLSAAYIPGSVPGLYQTKNPHHPLVLWAQANELGSLNQLAVKLDVSSARLSQIITRKHRPSVELALRIVRVTENEVSLSELLELTPAEHKAKIVAGWDDATPRKKPKRAKRR